jgi:hypothetical protein
MLLRDLVLPDLWASAGWPLTWESKKGPQHGSCMQQGCPPMRLASAGGMRPLCGCARMYCARLAPSSSMSR